MMADLILIAILVLNVLFGLKHGFFVMLGRLLLLLLSLAVTLLLLGPLTGLLSEAPFLAPLSEKLGESVLLPLEETAADISGAIDSFSLPPSLARLMQAELPDPDNSVTKAYPEFSAVLFKFALSAAAFILMFAIVSLVIRLLTKSLTKIADSLPLLGTVNRLGGLLAGLAIGLVQISIALLVLGFIAPSFPAVTEWIGQSRIAAHFYSLNILFFLL